MIANIPVGEELVIIDGQMEAIVTAGGVMELDSDQHELTVSLRPLPKVTQLLQNYPNSFNPETWIPYQPTSGVRVPLEDLQRQQYIGKKD